MARCDSVQELEDSFPREVITGSTRPRQATDWLAEIDQATPVHDLDDVGSVFGSTRMSFEHQYSKFAKGPHEGHEFNRKFLEAVEFCKSTKSPDVDRETDRLHNLRLVQDQRRSEESCEHERLAQYRVVNDTLKKFEAWEESLMALKELDAALLEGLVPSTVGEVDSQAQCLGAVSFRCNSPQRKNYSRLKTPGL